MDQKAEKLEKTNDLNTFSKEELIEKIKALEAHNLQLKNVIKGRSQKAPKSKKPFDFTKCNFRQILLKLFYLGWDYQGYAVQEDTTNTIEHYLFEALTKTCLIKDRQSSNYHRCGRTDKGVSAFSQVISIKVRSNLPNEPELDYCKMLNRVLPPSIQCIAWCPIQDGFSARFDCNSRTYKYFFPRGNLDVEKMRIAANFLVGTHDFRNFCKMDVGNGVVKFIRHILEIEIQSFEDKDEFGFLVLAIKGNAFLWHQIRCIMGMLLLIGQNKEEPELVKELLDIEKNPRKPDYFMASETPLNLYFSEYDNVEWIYGCLHSTIEKLENFWISHTVKSTMIKNMISDLESKTCNKNHEKKCLSECLIQGVKSKNYIPVMKRTLCESLENRIQHFSKKRKF